MGKMELFGKTDIGLRRTNNEDVFYVDLQRGFCLVADGMGGAAAGELASSIFAESARKTFSSVMNADKLSATELVKSAFQLANKNILEHIKEFPHHKGMGCTAELLAVSDGGLVLGHIGDSRTYRFRNGNLSRLTRDHSLVQEQVDKGLITARQAKKHPMKNVILKAVGISGSFEIDIISLKSQENDLYLMCSDGLTDMVDDEQILHVLACDANIEQKTQMLIDLAKTAGGLDNITLVLCRMLPHPE
ncbi:MAG: Stp1/IreP family PP2C-type Ser/Thr phosphatase [Desulfobacterales bacterium]